MTGPGRERQAECHGTLNDQRVSSYGVFEKFALGSPCAGNAAYIWIGEWHDRRSPPRGCAAPTPSAGSPIPFSTVSHDNEPHTV